MLSSVTTCRYNIEVFVDWCFMRTVDTDWFDILCSKGNWIHCIYSARRIYFADIPACKKDAAFLLMLNLNTEDTARQSLISSTANTYLFPIGLVISLPFFTPSFVLFNWVWITDLGFPQGKFQHWNRIASWMFFLLSFSQLWIMNIQYSMVIVRQIDTYGYNREYNIYLFLWMCSLSRDRLAIKLSAPPIQDISSSCYITAASSSLTRV